MSSIVKLGSHEIQESCSYIMEIGRAEFRWMIRDFEDFARIGDSISSSTFKVGLDDSSKVESFHFEVERKELVVELQGGKKGFEFQVSLIKDSQESVLAKLEVQTVCPQYLVIWKQTRELFKMKQNEKNKICVLNIQENFCDLPNVFTLILALSLHRAATK